MDWRRRIVDLVGADQVVEVLGGHQARVFEAHLGGGGRVILKVLDAQLVDRAAVERRAEVVAELAAQEPMVCRPLAIEGRLVTEIEGPGGTASLVTCMEKADGVAPRVDRPADAELMGRTLARLHRAMAALGSTGLPPVAALAAISAPPRGDEQLLHGDFGIGNLRISGSTVRVFDLDDCGVGPPPFDVANALYMVLFDELTSDAQSGFAAFSDAFVSGYGSEAGARPDPEELDGFIDLRVTALDLWLDHPTAAPIGIRTSTPEWRATLRRFIDTYRAWRR